MAAGASLKRAEVPQTLSGRLAAPTVVLREPSVTGMPTGATQEIRVLTACFGPGDRTAFNRHRTAVTVHVLEGHFTAEIEGRAPLVIAPGQAFVEPPELAHVGHNRSATQPLRVVVFYVSEPEAPFLDPVGGLG